MKRSVKLFFIFFLGITAFIKPQGITVTVDPRVELLSIIFRLAGNPEYNQCQIPNYNSAIDSYFNKYKDHPLIKYSAELRNTKGVAFDACMSMAININNIDSLGLRENFSATLDGRWPKEDLKKYLLLVKQFVADTKFTEFFSSQKELYKYSADVLQSLINQMVNLGWFEKFYGEKLKNSFNIILGMSNGGGNFGVKYLHPNGEEELYAVIGVWKLDAKGLPTFDQSLVETIVHEFSHSFVNHVADKHLKEFENSAPKIFEKVEKQLRRQAYGTWRVMIYESLVRASVVRYVLSNSGPEAAKKAIQSERNRSFVWIDQLVELFSAYENSRDKYPTFDSFIPVVADFFEKLPGTIDKLIEEIEKNKPKIISVNVPNDSEDVDPSLEEIQIKFSKPMAAGYSVNFLGSDRKKYFPEISKSEYDSSKTVFTIHCKLLPDHQYKLMLNSDYGGSFISEDGYILNGYLINFKTKKNK